MRTEWPPRNVGACDPDPTQKRALLALHHPSTQETPPIQREYLHMKTYLIDCDPKDQLVQTGSAAIRLGDELRIHAGISDVQILRRECEK